MAAFGVLRTAIGHSQNDLMAIAMDGNIGIISISSADFERVPDALANVLPILMSELWQIVFVETGDRSDPADATLLPRVDNPSVQPLQSIRPFQCAKKS